MNMMSDKSTEPTAPTRPTGPAAAHDQSHTPTRRLAATLATRHEREATPPVPLSLPGWATHKRAQAPTPGQKAPSVSAGTRTVAKNTRAAYKGECVLR